MAFERVTLTPRDGSERVTALFNPEEYTIESSVKYAEVGIPGQNRPPLQYVGGGARTLKMDLLFDTQASHIQPQYQNGDVRQLIRKVTNLASQPVFGKAPPVVLVSWGTFSMQCVIESISEKYTRFQANGTPTRAQLSVSFKEFHSLPDPETTDIVRALTRAVVAGDSLWKIANEELGDPADWRKIAKANNLDDPLNLPAGTKLRIPRF